MEAVPPRSAAAAAPPAASSMTSWIGAWPCWRPGSAAACWGLQPRRRRTSRVPTCADTLRRTTTASAARNEPQRLPIWASSPLRSPRRPSPATQDTLRALCDPDGRPPQRQVPLPEGLRDNLPPPTRLVPEALSAECAWQSPGRSGRAFWAHRRSAPCPRRRRGQRRALVPRRGTARNCRGATARARGRALGPDGGPAEARRRNARPGHERRVPARRGADARATTRGRFPSGLRAFPIRASETQAD